LKSRAVHREFLELLGQQPIVPGRDLGQPVIGPILKARACSRSEVIEATAVGTSVFAEKAACGKNLPCPTTILRSPVSQNWDIEIKDLDAVGQSAGSAS